MKHPRPAKRLFSGLGYSPDVLRHAGEITTQTAVTPEEIEQFIATIAATGCYENQFTGQVSPVSAERRNAACDWVEKTSTMEPIERVEFYRWATDTAQRAIHGDLQSPATAYPLVFGNQAQ